MRNRIYHWVLGGFVFGSAAFLIGCGGSETSEDSRVSVSPGHHHEPPHGGAPVVLGDEAFHLEFVFNSSDGLLRAYVLDGHMESFIRIEQPELELAIDLDGHEESVFLAAVANPDTGETVGDTAQFEATIDELVGVERFDCRVLNIEIGGATFSDVSFTYPEGNEGAAHSH